MNDNLSLYTYELPENLIAQTQISPPDHAKLLVIDTKKQNLTDQHVYDLPKRIPSKSLIILNNTKVIKARIPLHQQHIIDPQGNSHILNQGEIFVYKIIDTYHAEVLVSDGKHFRPGWQVQRPNHALKSMHFTKDGIMINSGNTPIKDILEQYGQLPLPPYITDHTSKQQRYQTRRAEHEGSVAAPTASLHLTPDIIDQLRSNDCTIHHITLHVGLGTFKPIVTSSIDQHHMHEETMIVSSNDFVTIARAKIAHQRIITIGTTVIRFCESLPLVRRQLPDHDKLLLPDDVQYFRNTLTLNNYQQNQQCTIRKISDHQRSVETHIFITPARNFMIADIIMTNFHLPQTTLLVLVSSFGGHSLMLKAYQHAIANNYRFYSFGDATLRGDFGSS